MKISRQFFRMKTGSMPLYWPQSWNESSRRHRQRHDDDADEQQQRRRAQDRLARADRRFIATASAEMHRLALRRHRLAGVLADDGDQAARGVDLIEPVLALEDARLDAAGEPGGAAKAIFSGRTLVARRRTLVLPRKLATKALAGFS